MAKQSSEYQRGYNAGYQKGVKGRTTKTISLQLREDLFGEVLKEKLAALTADLNTLEGEKKILLAQQELEKMGIKLPVD